MNRNIFKIILPVFLICSLIIPMACTPTDPITDDIYIEGDLYVWDGAAWVAVTGGGGVADFTDLGDTPANYVGSGGEYVRVNVAENALEFNAIAGGGDVTAGVNMTDHSVVRGDGGAKGVQDSTDGANDVTIDDFGNLTASGDIDGFDVNAGNDVNVTNDLDVTDAADIGGALAVVGAITEGGNGVLNTSDVDDTPVDAATTDPVSSNWAFDHNAAVPSSTVHPNTTMARAYLNAAQADIAAPFSRVQLDTASYDVGSNFNFGFVYNQTQSDADSDATHIEDDDAAFTSVEADANALYYNLVTWSSDAGGTLNTGSGYITSLDADTLAVAKTIGNSFAASYYYTIKECWYRVPTTGYYQITAAVGYLGASVIPDKMYGAVINVNSLNNAYQASHSSVAAIDLVCFVGDLISLTAGDIVSLKGVNTTAANTADLYNNFALTFLSIVMISSA